MSTRKLLAEVKQTNQDFEWYPTTDEIINVIRADIGIDRFGNTKDISRSVLDCGAGDGRVLKSLTSGKKYAIEKSKPLLASLDKDIFVVGTEFHEQTLIDKKVDVIFCNPPYSEFDVWMTKVISEANAAKLYFVVPTRWQKSETILAAIKLRRGLTRVLGEFDFLTADRAARANVHIVCVDLGQLHYDSHRTSTPDTDPFNTWFNENFKFDLTARSVSSYSLERATKEAIKSAVGNELVKGGDLVTNLEQFYVQDMTNTLETYRGLERIDGALLSELNISLEAVREALSLKVRSLKDVYWKELFNNLTRVTDRLTSDSRQKLLNTLTSHTHIDFTKANAHAILEWVIKNANSYFDAQLIDVTESLVQRANVKNYKSNEHLFDKNNWRYNNRPDNYNSTVTHYTLESRIVLEGAGGTSCDYTAINGLSQRAATLLDDLCTIAYNLGFDTQGMERSKDFSWQPNQAKEFSYKNHTTGKTIVLMKVKAFKNGNLHINFDQKFMCKLNVEFGRLKGWLKSAKDAVDETDIPANVAVEAFNSNMLLTSTAQLFPQLQDMSKVA